MPSAACHHLLRLALRLPQAATPHVPDYGRDHLDDDRERGRPWSQRRRRRALAVDRSGAHSAVRDRQARLGVVARVLAGEEARARQILLYWHAAASADERPPHAFVPQTAGFRRRVRALAAHVYALVRGWRPARVLA